MAMSSSILSEQWAAKKQSTGRAAVGKVNKKVTILDGCWLDGQNKEKCAYGSW
jgi:hypothetical protein